MRANGVAELWRYPVKSMIGERVSAADVTTNGVAGDRGWAVRDEERGGIRGSKKIGGLMQLAARYIREPTPGLPVPPVEVTLPDGSVVCSDDAAVSATLSRALDHQVTLWPLQPASDLDHYRRGAPDSDDIVEELRSIFGREPDEPLPDLSVFPPEIAEFESPPGTYFDAFPIHIVTTASLRRLGELAPGATVDVRRFRPNVVVAADGAAFVEQEWVGERLRVGAVELEVTAPCPRCVMVTRPLAELPQDRALLRTIVREADQVVGVYARAHAGQGRRRRHGHRGLIHAGRRRSVRDASSRELRSAKHPRHLGAPSSHAVATDAIALTLSGDARILTGGVDALRSLVGALAERRDGFALDLRKIQSMSRGRG